MPSRPQPLYHLAAHVHSCCSGSHVVLLDLKRDQYLGIDASDTEALRSRIIGLPTPDPSRMVANEGACQEKAPEGESGGLLQQMLGDGILVPAPSDAIAPKRMMIEKPEMELINGYVDVRTRVIFHDLVYFLTAAMTAAVLLRRCSIERIAARIRRRRDQAIRRAFNADGARRRMAILNRLRPLLYTAREECLFHSLVASEYLARYQCFPQLVFGVATNPFKAHCWLQHGRMVINDTPEYVREYTPIAAF